MGIDNLFSKVDEDQEIELLKKRIEQLKLKAKDPIHTDEVEIVEKIEEPKLEPIPEPTQEPDFDIKIDSLLEELQKNTLEEDEIHQQLSHMEEKINNLEKNTSKFILLYESMMNKCNPFVDKENLPLNSSKELLTKKVHDDISEDVYFILPDGRKLTSIYDLINALENMDENIFKHHVSSKHNDFASWIHFTLQLKDLAEVIAPIKSKDKILFAIKEYVK